MMIQGAPVVLGGKKKSNVPAFAYTGKYNVRDDDVVELLESGEITFVEDSVIDVFMVGGGGGGGMRVTSTRGFGGGGGGYTRTVKRLSVAANTQIPITVGAGGAVFSNDNGGPGSDSSFNLYTVPGGKGGRNSASGPEGGAGGSGGGTGVSSNSDYGAGGSDGANGEGNGAGVPGGTGQGFTTREFGESTGKLYAGGGGGGRYMLSQTPIVSSGGGGGGGTGAWAGANSDTYQVAEAGVANTGGGGGGGAVTVSGYQKPLPGTGGSGIVCFRKAQELPELAGTWVLNKRLYPAENTITQSLNFTLGSSSTIYNSILIDKEYVRVRADGQSGYSALYDFSKNSWGGNSTINITSTTASDEFRAWLASNATKQS